MISEYTEDRPRDFLTDDDIAAPEDEGEGFVGVGLVIAENGEMAIVHADGGIEDWRAFRVSYPEAVALHGLLGAAIE